jgi:hypothetical protein
VSASHPIVVCRANTVNTASQSVAAHRGVTSDAVAVRRGKSSATAMAYVAAHRNKTPPTAMALAAVRRGKTATTAMTSAAVRRDKTATKAMDSPKAKIVYSAKTSTKEWVSFNPSAVPTKFVIVAPPLPACTCQVCTHILAKVVYKVDCYFCDTVFDADPKCANMFFDYPHPYHELCGAYLCDKCQNSGELLSHRHQCSGRGQHICHNCIKTMDFLNCWECNISICNSYLNDCTVQCNSCEHNYCGKCWLDGIAHKYECVLYWQCVECKDGYCDSCSINGSSCGSPISLKDETKLSDNVSIEGDTSVAWYLFWK